MNIQALLADRKSMALALAALAQVFILAGILVRAAMPLWTGQEIRIDTIPVDPRSLFRGNYALLRYEFSSIEGEYVPDDTYLREGEVIYVSLQPGEDGKHVFAAATLEKPETGVYLRGRVQGAGFGRWRSNIPVDYGIEAFFAPREEALALESELRDGGVAVLMVSQSGRARLKDVIGEEQ